jgi:hypothetical protein
MNDEFFHKNPQNKTDGFFPYCKKCNCKKTNKWQKDNPDKWKELNDNKNHNPSKKTKQYWRDKAKRQRESGYQKNYFLNNPDKCRQYRINHHNHDITDSEFHNCCLVFNYRCAYCNKTWEEQFAENNETFHREHVDHFGSDDLSNCVPACTNCNSQKWQHELDNWYNPRNPIYDKNRYEKIIWWITEGYKKYQENKSKLDFIC